MVSLSELQENRLRSEAGTNLENLIIHPKILRKVLLKIYYADTVNEIMAEVVKCDMLSPEPKMIDLGNGVSVIEDFEAGIVQHG